MSFPVTEWCRAFKRQDQGYLQLYDSTGQSPCVQAWPAAPYAEWHSCLWRERRWRRYTQCGAIYMNLTFLFVVYHKYCYILHAAYTLFFIRVRAGPWKSLNFIFWFSRLWKSLNLIFTVREQKKQVQLFLVSYQTDSPMNHSCILTWAHCWRVSWSTLLSQHC